VQHQRGVLRAAKHRLEQAGRRIDATERGVRALDPHRVLARGYSVTRDDAGRVVRGIARLAPGARLTTQLAAGTVRSTVTGVEASADGPEDVPEP
jgi:exodeoxyribonuclease VII large subunit